ncbi:hypothetical protein GPJ56_005844 [Histomonas meleagridis]|uniref:uncharacterized protein n=1 Tax=Histomonas meleagridis TaxID=135588 RepID=UPI003559F7AD|nr:hypothetical protein GPJ56_005844 [Histomonas meleagridis]KAH0798621.1 hypothetical protein GO595_008486 [Histomonas meleagridis]
MEPEINEKKEVQNQPLDVNDIPLCFRVSYVIIFTIGAAPWMLIFVPIIMICKFFNTIIHCICPDSKRWCPCPCCEGNCIDYLWFRFGWQFYNCCPSCCYITAEECTCCGKPSCICQTPYFRCTSEECCCCCCPDPTEDSIERANARMSNRKPTGESAVTIPTDQNYNNPYFNEEQAYAQGTQYYPYVNNEMVEDNLVPN